MVIGDVLNGYRRSVCDLYPSTITNKICIYYLSPVSVFSDYWESIMPPPKKAAAKHKEVGAKTSTATTNDTTTAEASSLGRRSNEMMESSSSSVVVLSTPMPSSPRKSTDIEPSKKKRHMVDYKDNEYDEMITVALQELIDQQKVLASIVMQTYDMILEVKSRVDYIEERCRYVMDGNGPTPLDRNLMHDATCKLEMINAKIVGKCMLCPMKQKQHGQINNATKACHECSLRFGVEVKVCNGCWNNHLFDLSKHQAGNEIRYALSMCYGKEDIIIADP